MLGRMFLVTCNYVYHLLHIGVKTDTDNTVLARVGLIFTCVIKQ